MGILFLNKNSLLKSNKTEFKQEFLKQGFFYYEYKENEVSEDDNESDFIIFLIEGELEITLSTDIVVMKAGTMICIGKGLHCKFRTLKAGVLVVAKFENFIYGCERILFTALDGLEVRNENSIFPLVITERLKSFLDLLQEYIKDGAGCFLYHELKLKELFLSIRFYYTKEEQAAFFQSVLGNSNDFKNKIMTHHAKARTVKELSNLCGYSLSSFKRKFSAEYNQPASTWLQNKINEQIKSKLLNEENTLGNIAEDLNFSSQAHFSRYCKKVFGCSPKEWRERMKKDYLSENDKE